MIWDIVNYQPNPPIRTNNIYNRIWVWPTNSEYISKYTEKYTQYIELDTKQQGKTRATLKYVCICGMYECFIWEWFLYKPWKSKPPFFLRLVYEPLFFFIVRVYHHPKGTTIFKMVDDFQGIDLMIAIVVKSKPLPAASNTPTKAELKSWTASRIGELTQVLLKISVGFMVVKLTASFPLKMDGWEAIFILGRLGLFLLAMLVSGRVTTKNHSPEEKSQGHTKESIEDDETFFLGGQNFLYP